MRSLRSTPSTISIPKGLARVAILASGLFAASACSDDAPGSNTNTMTTNGSGETGGEDPHLGGPGCDPDERISLVDDLPIVISNNGASIGEVSLDAVVNGAYIQTGNSGGNGNPDFTIIATKVEGDSACDSAEVIFTDKFKDVENTTIDLGNVSEYRSVCDVTLSAGGMNPSVEITEFYTCPDESATETGEISAGTEESGGSESETGMEITETSGDGDGDPATGSTETGA